MAVLAVRSQQRGVTLDGITAQDAEHAAALHYVHDGAAASADDEGEAEGGTEQAVDGVDGLDPESAGRRGGDGAATASAALARSNSGRLNAARSTRRRAATHAAFSLYSAV